MTGRLLLGDDEFISVTVDLIGTVGPTEAIVISHIYFRMSTDLRAGGYGECAATQVELAEDLRVSRDVVYRALKKLLEMGVVKIQLSSSGKGRAYVVDRERLEEIYDGQQTGLRDIAQNPALIRAKSCADSRKIDVHIEEVEELEEEKPPTPLKGGTAVDASLNDPQPELPMGDGVASMKEKRRRAKGSSEEVLRSSFDQLWDAYRGTMPPGQSVGAKPKAFAAYKRTVKGGTSQGDLVKRLRHYADVRAEAHGRFGAPPRIMHMSTWLGRSARHEEWIDPPQFEDERADQWKHGCEKDAAVLQAADPDRNAALLALGKGINDAKRKAKANGVRRI